MQPTANPEAQTAPEMSFAEIKAALYGKAPAPAAETPAPEPEPVAPEAPDAATPATETPAVEPKSTEAAPEAAPAQEPEGERSPKLEKRFSKLTKRAHEAEAEAAALKAELAALKTAPRPSPVEVKPAAAVDVSGRPMRPERPKFDDLPYEEMEKARAAYDDAVIEYTEKLTDWKADQKIKQAQKDIQGELVQAEERKRSEAVQHSWVERATAAIKADPEFADAAQSVGTLLTGLGMAPLVMESEVGVELVKHLYDNRDEAKRIGSLPNPLSVARELGKIEQQLIAAKPPTKAAAPVSRPQPPLPKPIATVGGTASPDETPIEKMSLAQMRQRLYGSARR